MYKIKQIDYNSAARNEFWVKLILKREYFSISDN